MNHPELKEWLAYLEGESSPEAQRHLAEHLNHCAQCADEVAAWRRSIHRLGSWQWPRPQGAHRLANSFLVKWGIAALLMLGVGFSLGRFSSASAREVKASVTVQLRDELRRELKIDLLAAVADPEQPTQNEFQRQLRSRFKASLTSILNGPARQEQPSVQEILQAVLKNRVQDRREVLALLSQFQQQLAADYLSLRKDLENLASTADDRLQQTRWQLTQLAANTSPASNKP
jgi:hypothetical protein